MVGSAAVEAPVLLVSHLHPQLGIEKVAISLYSALRPATNIRLCVLGDNTADAATKGIILGPPLRGLRRLASVPRLLRWLRSVGDGQVIVAAGVWVALPLLVARRFSRSRPIVVVWEHSLSAEKIASSRSLRLLDSMASIAYRKAERVVAVSEPLARRLREVGIVCTVVPNIVEGLTDLEPFEPSHQKRPRSVALVGSLTATKNHELMLQTMALLREPIFVDIYGDGPERSRLEAMAKDLGVSQHVRFHGYVGASQIRDALARVELLVHPSLGETFGLALFDGLRARVPVVAIDAPVMNSYVGTYVPGWLAEPTPGSLAATIESAFRTPIPQAEWALARKLSAEVFDTEAVASRWLSILKELESA